MNGAAMYAASRKCVSSSGNASLNMAESGSTFVGRPSDPIWNPAGEFIQALAEMIDSAPMMATNGIGNPSQKCVHGLSRRHP